MESNKKVWFWIAGIVVVAVVAYFWVNGSGNSSPVSGQVIKIGYVGPLSGDAAAYGQEMQKILTYRLGQINQEAGANGVRFEMVYEDGKCSGNDSANAFQKLVNVDGVKIILGGACSSETLGMAPLADENKVLLLSALSSNPKIEGIGAYTLSLSYSDKNVGENLAKEMSVYKKLAIITEQNDYNVGLRDAFMGTLKQYPNAKVVADEIFPKGATDFRAMLEKVKSVGPDAILLNPNPGVTSTNLLRQMAEMKNWSGFKLFGEYAYTSDSIRASSGNFSEGMIIIDSPHVNTPELLAAKDAVVKNQGGTLDNIGNYYIASTLDAINLITALVAKDGNDATKVKDDLSTGKFKGYIGDIEFKGSNFVHLGLVGKSIVKDGKAVLQN